MAGCAARGQTILHGAAKEPEIVDLAAFLNRCGGRIDGAGTDEIRIEGPCALHGASWRPVPDRICASTLACAVASARGWVTIAGCSPALYAPVLDVLEGAGCTVVRGTSSATVGRMGTLRGGGPSGDRRLPRPGHRCRAAGGGGAAVGGGGDLDPGPGV